MVFIEKITKIAFIFLFCFASCIGQKERCEKNNARAFEDCIISTKVVNDTQPKDDTNKRITDALTTRCLTFYLLQKDHCK